MENSARKSVTETDAALQVALVLTLLGWICHLQLLGQNKTLH